MVKRKDSLSITVNKEMRGGSGSVTLEHLLDEDAMYNKARLYARIILKPGCSIGFHKHEGEMETYYIIKGAVVFDDDGEKTTLYAGDVAYTPDGHSHSAANDGDEDAEFVALIIRR